MIVQPKARSASMDVGSCHRRYRIGERHGYAAQVRSRGCNAEAVHAGPGVASRAELLARQRKRAAAFICHSLSSAPVAPVCTRAYGFSGFTPLTSTLPLGVKGHIPGLLWIRCPAVAAQIPSAPPHVATTPCHTAVAEPELFPNLLGGRAASSSR